MMDQAEALHEIRKRIGGCFGTQDKIFAGHKFDENHSRELRKIADGAAIPRNVMLRIVTDYLQGCHPDHINEQVKRAEKFFKKLA